MGTCRIAVLGLAVAVIGLAQIPGAAAAKPPKIEVSLLADRSAWVPGESVGLAVCFKIEEGWHIYWRNRGEGGLEPSFKWTVPPGWTIGELRYPYPRRYVDAGGEHTFILEGEPTILTAVAVPKDAAAGSEAAVSVDVAWLACRKACFLGNKTLTLTLPVAGSAVRAEPANEEAFQLARSYLPVPAAEARHLKQLRALASVDKVKPGSKFEVAVVFDVADGHHINSHRPLNEFLVPTDVFNHTTEKLYIGRARFPRGKLESSGLPGEQVSVYRGQAAVLLPVEAEPGLTGGHVRLSGVATYQACADATKVCYAPMAVEWELVLPVAQAAETPQNVNTELFEAARRELEPQAVSTAPPGNVAQTAPVPEQPPEEPAATAGREPTPLPTSGSWLGRLQAALMRFGLAGYLILSLAGGFVLNLMPCVLPVISIKILSFVQQSKESRLRVLTLGLAFAAGIELSFIALGILIVGLGRTWGGLFQYPQTVIGLSAVVTAFSLSLFGVFALFPPKVAGEIAGRVEGEGHLSAFGMGLLATLLGTACSAPILATAVAWASQQTAATGMLIFVTAGLGMSLPYVILAAVPVWLRFLPRAGPWMTTFEQVVGFCLLATVVWLLSVVGSQLGGAGVVRAVLFLLLVSVGAWLYGKVEYDAPAGRKVRYYAAAALLVIGGWRLCFHWFSTIPELIDRQRSLLLGEGPKAASEVQWEGDEIPWIPYTRARALKAVEEGHTVFIDYTADWCVNCKANEKAVINTHAVREAMKRLRVLPFKADYTLPNPEIAEDLRRYGSGGVPLYLIVPAGRPDQVIRLDEVLTPSALIGGLEKAGPSKAG